MLRNNRRKEAHFNSELGRRNAEGKSEPPYVGCQAIANDNKRVPMTMKVKKPAEHAEHAEGGKKRSSFLRLSALFCVFCGQEQKAESKNKLDAAKPAVGESLCAA